MTAEKISRQYVNLSKIKSNPNNPRIIKDDAFKKLVQSLKDFPEMIEVLIGHKKAFIVIESNVNISNESIHDIVYRLSEISSVEVISVAQDAELARNQHEKFAEWGLV